MLITGSETLHKALLYACTNRATTFAAGVPAIACEKMRQDEHDETEELTCCERLVRVRARDSYVGRRPRGHREHLGEARWTPPH